MRRKTIWQIPSEDNFLFNGAIPENLRTKAHYGNVMDRICWWEGYIENELSFFKDVKYLQKEKLTTFHLNAILNNSTYSFQAVENSSLAIWINVLSFPILGQIRWTWLALAININRSIIFIPYEVWYKAVLLFVIDGSVSYMCY